ncbi:MAG: HD domain-containing protein [Bacteroidales bacterium]|nr:HD domain-containing protein [Bacteroidales bacterium]
MLQYIDSEILPRYAHFDAAHRGDHAQQVIHNSLQLAQHYPVEINMVYTIAAYHDIGLCEGRERHHIVSGELIRGDTTLRKWFDEKQISLMAEAVEDHRASAQQAPRSIYGKIVAEADRDIEPQKIVQRTVQYGLTHQPEADVEAQWQRIVEHLEEKYGEGGYLQLWLPESPNAAKLKELRDLIHNRSALRQAFENALAAETGRQK